MPTSIKLAYYHKRDWKKLLESADDRDNMHDTWEDWHKDYLRARDAMRKSGQVVHEVPVNIDALNKYCFDHGLANTGTTRSQYAAQLPLPGEDKPG